jgi:hypothetical protein
LRSVPYSFLELRLQVVDVGLQLLALNEAARADSVYKVAVVVFCLSTTRVVTPPCVHPPREQTLGVVGVVDLGVGLPQLGSILLPVSARVRE